MWMSSTLSSTLTPFFNLNTLRQHSHSCWRKEEHSTLTSILSASRWVTAADPSYRSLPLWRPSKLSYLYFIDATIHVGWRRSVFSQFPSLSIINTDWNVVRISFDQYLFKLSLSSQFAKECPCKYLPRDIIRSWMLSHDFEWGRGRRIEIVGHSDSCNPIVMTCHHFSVCITRLSTHPEKSGKDIQNFDICHVWRGRSSLDEHCTRAGVNFRDNST